MVFTRAAVFKAEGFTFLSFQREGSISSSPLVLSSGDNGPSSPSRPGFNAPNLDRGRWLAVDARHVGAGQGRQQVVPADCEGHLC